MDTKSTVYMEVDGDTADGGRRSSCGSVPHGGRRSSCGSAAQDERPKRGIRRMSGTILAGSLKEAARLAQFQPARPAHGISPKRNLLDQSRDMRMALNISCHGDAGGPTDDFLDNGGGLVSQFDITDDDDDDDGDGDDDAWKLGDPLHESTRCWGNFRNKVGRIVNLGPIQWTLMGKFSRQVLRIGPRKESSRIIASVFFRSTHPCSVGILNSGV